MARAIERTTSCSCWRPLLERPTALAHNSKREREKISRSSLARDILDDRVRDGEQALLIETRRDEMAGWMESWGWTTARSGGACEHTLEVGSM